MNSTHFSQYKPPPILVAKSNQQIGGPNFEYGSVYKYSDHMTIAHKMHSTEHLDKYYKQSHCCNSTSLY